MSDAELVAIDLTERERRFIYHTLHEWSGSAGWTPLPIDALGLANWDEFDALTDRLTEAIAAQAPLTDLDWARVLFLAEITFASDLVGAASDFEIVSGFSDVEGITVLRQLQRKIAHPRRADLLFPGRGRPRDMEQLKREVAKMKEKTDAYFRTLEG